MSLVQSDSGRKSSTALKEKNKMKAYSLLIIPMALTMFSCQQENKTERTKNPQVTVITPQVIEKQVSSKRLEIESDKEYAAKLVRVGEILVNNPVGFTHANNMFNKALAIDPQNNKALFYSAFTQIIMSMKGSVGRGRNLLDDPAEYDKFVDHLTKKIKYPEFVDFLVGKKTQSKFKNYQDIKRFFQNEVIDAFENANKKLNKIDGKVDVILTQLKTDNSKIEYNCQDVTEDGGYTYTRCDLKEEMNSVTPLPAKTTSVDLEDIKILASGLKGYSTVFKLYTAYGVIGQKHLTNEIQIKEVRLGRALTEKEMHRIVTNYSDYLVLEKDHRMNEIVQDLESIVEVGMDLETLNNQFCDNDLRNNNLIKSICFSKTARADMQQALDYLSGPQEVALGQDVNGSDVKILVDLPTYLNNPVADLKTLIPDQYNDDGSAYYTFQPELNGLFPNNDLIDKLKQLKSE